MSQGLASQRCPWRAEFLLLGALALVCSCTSKVELGAWSRQQTLPPPASNPTATSGDTALPPPASDAEAPPPLSDPPTDTVSPPPTQTAPSLDSGAGQLAEAGARDAQAEIDAALDAMSPALPFPSCAQVAEPGTVNAPGGDMGSTETSTDWTWSAPANSMRFKLMIEQSIEREGAVATAGYYWEHQFSFVQGVAGILGLQAEGVYQEEPPDSEGDITKMAVFWLSGPPLDAELGEIDFPNARVAPQAAAGANWLTIHARFDWQVCHVYEMRFAPHETLEDGSVWYGAWIADLTDATDVFLGRMLLPADPGLLAPFSITNTSPIDYFTPLACGAIQHVSAVFGAPSAVDTEPVGVVRRNRFDEAARCGSSRFTDFELAVRHELGVPQ